MEEKFELKVNKGQLKAIWEMALHASHGGLFDKDGNEIVLAFYQTHGLVDLIQDESRLHNAVKEED